MKVVDIEFPILPSSLQTKYWPMRYEIELMMSTFDALPSIVTLAMELASTMCPKGGGGGGSGALPPHPAAAIGGTAGGRRPLTGAQRGSDHANLIYQMQILQIWYDQWRRLCKTCIYPLQCENPHYEIRHVKALM